MVMKKVVVAISAALLLALPAACMHPGHHGPGGPGGPGCPQHQGCNCKCRQQQPDCPKKENCPNKTESGQKPDCPQHRQQEPPPPAK
jgi:hypothetical protein